MDAIPKDFSEALKESGLGEVFAGNAPSHQREYLKWITGAKRPETRKERMRKAMKMLSAKRAEKAARSRKHD